MCKVINFNEYRGNKDTKKSVKKVEQVKKYVEKRDTGGLSTEVLIKEFVENGRSVLKLVLYIIEQYGRIGENVRRHIVGGANRTLISAITSLRSCGIGTCRRLSSG